LRRPKNVGRCWRRKRGNDI